MLKRSHVKILAIFIAIWSLTAAGSLFAQEWIPLDKASVLGKASQATKERYPDAEVVLLDQHKWVKYNQDGTYSEWFEQFVKLLTEKGKRRFRTLTSSFTVPYNNTRFTLVEVISPDGTARRIDLEKNSRVMVDPSQMSANIYDPNDKILQVSVPELSIGDTVHLITFDDFFKTRMTGQFSDYITFEDTDPIISSRLTVIAPEVKPLASLALKNEIPGTVSFTKTEEGGEIIYKWVAKDVPMAFEEPEMPPLYTQAQRLLVSTIPDWKTISRWYWNLSKPHLEKTTPEMRKTVRTLTRGKKGSTERMETIFFWVSQQIRYLGITAETEAPGYEPHPVSMTFERRAGVCRDKAALLVAMLRLAGFDAYPVLIMNGPKKDPEVPQPFFNHAIACVRAKDGSYTLMDPTNENTKELFPSYLNNQSYVVATPLGDTLRTSPITPAEQNMLRISTTGKLDSRGTLKGRTLIAFSGINDNAYRGYFSRITDEERKLYIERMLMKNVPGAVLEDLSLKPANIMDTSKELQVTFSFSAGNYPVKGDGVTMLPVFRFTDSIGVSNFLITKMGLKERKYTYMTETACGTQESVDIEYDQSLGTPVSQTIQYAASDEGASWSRSLRIGSGIMKSSNLFIMKLTEYSPAQYKGLQDILKKVEKANRITPVFTKTQSQAADPGSRSYGVHAPDAVVLDEDVTFDIIDGSTVEQSVRRKIQVLNYAGKKKHSELYFSFNPVWEDIRIKKATVTAPGGIMQEINPNEVNIMDQDWVGKAPRYPAGKVMVASLPGLQEGSIIEYEYIKRKKDAWPLFITGVFQGEDPIEKKTLRIRVPAGIQLKLSKSDNGFNLGEPLGHFPKGFIKEARKQEGDITVLEYSVEKVPPIKQEDSLPPDYSFMPTVMASNADMGDYASRINAALNKASDGQSASAKKSAEITRGIAAWENKITAVRDFVEKNIKPVGIAFSQLPLSQVSSADATLASGYAGSTDRAVLLAAMIKSLGLNTQFLITSTASPVQSLQGPLSTHPASDWFAGVLVQVTDVEGKNVILGNTDQYAELGTVSQSGNPALNVSTGRIEMVKPAGPQFQDRGDTRYTIDLGPDGNALITIRRTYYGAAHASFCKDYIEMSPEEKRRRFQEIVSSISRSATASSPYKVFCETYPATEEFSVLVPGYAVRQKDMLSLELPGISRAIAGVTSGDRSNPLHRDSFINQDLQVEVLLPAGTKAIELSPPESRKFSLPGTSELSISSASEPDASGAGFKGRMRFVVRQHSDIKPGIVMPGEYPRLLDMHQELANPGNRTILVRMDRD